MQAYKLVRLRKDGSIGPLFCNRSQRIPLNKWIKAESHPTKGLAYRPHWHCVCEPIAPHLSLTGRIWVLIEIKDYSIMTTPKHQGGKWFLANKIKVIKRLDEEVN